MLIKTLGIELVCSLLVCVRKLLGPIRCRYPMGCTSFALQKLRSQPLHKAIWASVRRVCSCTSWQPLNRDLF